VTIPARILTVPQAAEQLQVCERTLYEWLRSGRIPGRKIGRMWRMSEQVLIDFLRGDLFDRHSSPDDARDAGRA
jgi:excisionase family DNA binding protein